MKMNLLIDGVSSMPGQDRTFFSEIDPLFIALICIAVALFLIVIGLIITACKKNKEMTDELNLKRESLTEEEIELINSIRTRKKLPTNPFLKFDSLTEAELNSLYEYRKNNRPSGPKQKGIFKNSAVTGIICTILILALIGIILFIIFSYT